MLDQADAAELLQETLDEEMATDERLSEIAEAVMTGDEIEEEAEEEPEEEEITSE
jgi:ferritin-like metal-binding protein YciE